jgi:5-methylcytosine-specific restriction endonuclease McrA
MKNLVPLADSAIAHYDMIASAKLKERGPRLAQLRSNVSRRYDEYANSRLMLELMKAVTFTEEQAGDLRHCYTSPTKPLDSLVASIRKNQAVYGRAICGYCGINAPSTIDHYLPDKNFPEFSVCHGNLLPACGECNSLKGDSWTDKDGERLVIHLYYDALPMQHQWLYANVELVSGVPTATFNLRRQPHTNPKLFARVEAHYRTLNLTERYAARAPEMFSEMPSGLTRTEFVRECGARARSLINEHGANYWKVPLYDAILASNEYLGTITS